MQLTADQLLIEAICNEILKVADLSEEMTRSDLQGLAYVSARSIIQMVKDQSTLAILEGSGG